MPMTFSGRFVSAAILVIEIEEVLVARMISGRHMRSRSRNNLRLDLKLLRRRLDHEVNRRECFTIRRCANAPKRRIFLLCRDLAFAGLALQILADRVERALQEAFLYIAQNNVISRFRKHVSNAVAHRSRADHADGLDVH